MAKYYKTLNLSTSERTIFKEAVKKELNDRGLTIPGLATEIGYSRKSVWQFLNDDDIVNKYIAAAIEDFLNLKWR